MTIIVAYFSHLCTCFTYSSVYISTLQILLAHHYVCNVNVCHVFVCHVVYIWFNICVLVLQSNLVYLYYFLLSNI